MDSNADSGAKMGSLLNSGAGAISLLNSGTEVDLLLNFGARAITGPRLGLELAPGCGQELEQTLDCVQGLEPTQDWAQGLELQRIVSSSSASSFGLQLNRALRFSKLKTGLTFQNGLWSGFRGWRELWNYHLWSMVRNFAHRNKLRILFLWNRF